MRVYLLLYCLAGAFSRATAVIDWAAAVSAAGAAASAVTSGGSFIGSLAATSGYKVVCTTQIENWTKYPLVYPETHINGGIIQSPPVAVMPGKREQFIAHKTGYTATGTYGTASWLISSASIRAVVMWSCPFNFDHYSNWLGVGLTTEGHTQHKDWFQQMYYGKSGSDLRFQRDEYYYHTKTLSIKDNKFEITGIMGTSHKAQAHIIVRPLDINDLADTLRERVESLPIVG